MFQLDFVHYNVGSGKSFGFMYCRMSRSGLVMKNMEF